MLDGSRTIAESRGGTQLTTASGYNGASGGRIVHVGLVNNMPDSALLNTERQFAELLREAAGSQLTAQLHLLAIPQVSRGATAVAEMKGRYRDVNELAGMNLDALIVTGLEPRAPHLEDEPYWSALTRLCDWAENNVNSVVWSCLAAHATVKHLDNVERRPIGFKRFGVFNCEIQRKHPLLSGLSSTILVPHSRYNELVEDDLLRAAYSVLTRSATAGVDIFAKRRKRCLFVFFQGHPEYDATSLWREYRRDVTRFLNSERAGYPKLPVDYLHPADARKCKIFAARAMTRRDPELVSAIPDIDEQAYRSPSWRSSAVSIYRNWLRQLAEQQQTSSSSLMMTEFG